VSTSLITAQVPTNSDRRASDPHLGFDFNESGTQSH
jgi:hypothetical protein